MSSGKIKDGYTLIELLVVITISIIVFGVGMASYREFSRRQDLAAVTKRLISDLRLIQQLALTGQKPTGVTCTRLVGYTFSRATATNYTITANCDNSGTPASFLTKSVDFPTGVTFTATTASTQFKVLGQGTNLSADNVLSLTNSSTSNTATVTIGRGGDIK